MKNSRYGFGFIAILVLICAVGCGDKIKFGGKVTFSDDGSPLTAGTVVFATDTLEARGSLQADGTYKMSSDKEGDGLPPGKYKVYIRDAYTYERVGTAENATDVSVALIDSKYSSPNSSDLECEVSSSKRTYEFKVDRPQK